MNTFKVWTFFQKKMYAQTSISYSQEIVHPHLRKRRFPSVKQSIGRVCHILIGKIVVSRIKYCSWGKSRGASALLYRLNTTSTLGYRFSYNRKYQLHMCSEYVSIYWSVGVNVLLPMVLEYIKWSECIHILPIRRRKKYWFLKQAFLVYNNYLSSDSYK